MNKGIKGETPEGDKCTRYYNNHRQYVGEIVTLAWNKYVYTLPGRSGTTKTFAGARYEIFKGAK